MTTGMTDGKRQAALQKKRKSTLLRRIRQRWLLFLFIAIPLVWLLVFHYYPMLGLQIAFKKFRIADGIWGSQWVGFKHFTKFFHSIQFSRVIVNTIRLSMYSLIAGFPLPIILALCMNAMKNIRYKKFVQTLTYLPHFISTVVLVGMINQIFSIRVGAYGYLGRLLTGEVPRDILAKPFAFTNLYVWSGVWQNMGWSSIVYMAALASTSTELHEAAQIDGASHLQRCIHIDFPSILPTTIIMLIMNAGSVLNVGFEKVFLMQNALNLSQSEVISTYLYKVTFDSVTNDFSYSTAIGLFNSVVNMGMLVIVNAISRRVSETSLW